MKRVRVVWDRKPVDRAVESGGFEGVKEAAEHVLRLSQQRVPYDTGALMQSGKITTDKQKIQAAVNFGTDPETEKYAVRQHEDLSYHHPALGTGDKRPVRESIGRQAKYLEGPLNESAQVIADTIARAIKEHIK
jgi:hypothetical protein